MRAWILAGSLIGLVAGGCASSDPKLPAPPPVDPRTEALADAERLAGAGRGALVFHLRRPAGVTGTRYSYELHGGAGYKPGQAGFDEHVVVPDDEGARVLRIRMKGFHELTYPVDLVSGQVHDAGSLEPDPVTPETAGVVRGDVWLEGDPSIGFEVKVMPDGPSAIAAHGAYELTDVGAGLQRIRLVLEGYRGVVEEVLVERGETTLVEHRLHRARRAHVRWAYQPAGTRDLGHGLKEGTARLRSHPGLNRVRFRGGFRQVQGQSDFMVRQEGDRLVLWNFDRGNAVHGIAEVPGPFEEVLEAPAEGYGLDDRPLVEGRTYVVRTYDGSHYGKFVVDRIDTGE